MELRAKIEDLNGLVLQGRALEAFDKYYAENVVMEEAGQRWEGKELNRSREEDFFGKITELRGAEVRSVNVGDDTTAVEWHFDYTHAEWGDMKYDQVALQRWEDGLIVSERFYKI